MNPYEVLGVSENATDEEVKKAYKELVKKYHPDKYTDNSLSDLAAEKIKEINIAYDTIMRQRSQRQSGDDIAEMIRRGDINSAEAKLQAIAVSQRTAQWYYLYGEICRMRGWTDNARSYYTTAVNMEPGNPIYQAALSNLYRASRTYAGDSAARGYSDSDQCCRICQTLYCLDCCCECMGGDLIPCC